MAGGTRSNAIIAVLLAVMVTSGSWVAFQKLTDSAEIICIEGEELIGGECIEIPESGTHGDGGENITSDDCTLSQVWRDEECQTMLAPSNLSYGDNEFSFVFGQTTHDVISPSFSGDAPDNWAATPNLPAGMTLSNSTGEIIGQPGVMTAQNYTIVASNNVGSTSIQISIAGLPMSPIFQLAHPSILLILGIEVDLEPPSIHAGNVVIWSVNPPLPAGLTLGNDGGIDGMASEMGATSHTITGENAGGLWAQNLTITIVEAPPSGIYYSGNPFVLRIGNNIMLESGVSSGGQPVSWEIMPPLPSGLSLNSTSGNITGVPTDLSPETIYVVWANNSGGSNSTTLTLTVIDLRPKQLDFDGNYLDLALLVEQVNITPTFTGGSPISWEVEPALPNGLELNSSTGRISGAATELWAWTNHTVWANNSGGVGMTILHIQVVDLTPTNITWNGTIHTFEANVSVRINATNSGPSIESWEISPPLPVGLAMSGDNGSISGTPTQRSGWTTYQIWANNSGGSFSANLTMAVHDLDADWSDITAGVSSIDYGSSWPSLIIPFGDWSFPIGLDWDDRPIISAGHVGMGKIVGYGHETMVKRTSGDEGTLSMNALQWACDDGTNVALASDFNSWKSELEAEGYSVVTSATPDDLVGMDCFVGEFWNGWSESQDRKVEQFMQGGGGVILGGHAWYWSYSNSDAAHNYPGNQISRISGLMVSTSPGSSSMSFPSTPHNSLHQLRPALKAISAHMTTGPLLNQADSSIAAGAVSRSVSALPFDFIDFWTQVRAMSNESGWIHINSSYTYTLGADAVDDLVLNIQEKLMLGLPADELLAHPSSFDFPGETPPNSPRVNTTVTVNGSFVGLPSQFGYANAGAHGRMSTGLFAAAGEVVNVSLPAELVDQGAYILVGAHSDSLWSKTTLSRHPNVVRWWPVDNTSMQVGNSFGGPIYVAFSKGSSFGQVEVMFENAVEMPYYVHGETSISDWQSIVRNHPAPIAELASGYFILTVPSKDIRNLDDPDYAMDFWDEALQMEHNLSGYTPWPRIERAVFDVQISAGWMHSGYPFMAHHASVSGVVNGSKMYQDGDWGMFHELGHNHQWMSSTLPGTTETTCNLYSVKLMTDLVGKDLREGHGSINTASAKNRVENYFNNGANTSSWSVWTALETYLQIYETFGWEPITAAYQEYYYNYTTQPSGDTDEFNQWAKQISINTGMNLVPFLSAWGFPLTQSTFDSVGHLPVWTTDPLRGWVHDYDPILSDLIDTNVTSSSADLNFEVYDNGTDVNLTVCWGLADGGNITTMWDNCQGLGISSVGGKSYSVSGLISGQTYHWRAMGENDNGQTWTPAAIFTTS